MRKVPRSQRFLVFLFHRLGHVFSRTLAFFFYPLCHLLSISLFTPITFFYKRFNYISKLLVKQPSILLPVHYRLYPYVFYDPEHVLVLSKLMNMFVKHGKPSLLYPLLLKFLKQHNKNQIFPHVFLYHCLSNSVDVPFLLNKFKTSNRMYTFPIPFWGRSKGMDSDMTSFLFRKRFSFFFNFIRKATISLTSRKYFNNRKNTFSNMLFELFVYLNLVDGFSPDNSVIQQGINRYIFEGIDNRVFIHYRWRLLKKK